MKIILSKYLLFIFLLPISTWSQVSIVVDYNFLQKTPNVQSVQKVTLLTNGKEAKLSMDIPKLINASFETTLNEGNIITTIEKPKQTNTNWFFKPDKNKIVKSIQVQSKHKVIHDQLPDYKWEILEEYDTIGKYQVIKAKTFFRGRTFIAWFTPNIPVGYGPWKLNGLPGLILKMHDKDHLFLWYIKAINLNAKVTDTDFNIPTTKNDILLTYEEAMRIFMNKQKEKAKRTNTKLMGRGGHFEHKVNTESRLEKVFEWEEVE